MDPIIEIRSLHAGYPIHSGLLQRVRDWTQVLKDINLTIPRGETLGLVGESGCGKTTLGRAILGLAPVRSGSILYHRHGETVELRGLPEKEFRVYRKELQIIFQDPFSSLNPLMTVGGILMEGVQHHFHSESHSAREDRCADALRQVGLGSDALRKFPHEFSGGQRQRISIARALVLEPSFIVCDESVSALDVSIQAQIINLLIDLQERHRLSYLFISHDLSVVRHISHRIAVINEGRIVEEGTSEEVTENPADPYTKKLIAAIPRIRL